MTEITEEDVEMAKAVHLNVLLRTSNETEAMRATLAAVAPRIAAREREACAKAVEAHIASPWHGTNAERDTLNYNIRRLADAIRARSTKETADGR